MPDLLKFLSTLTVLMLVLALYFVMGYAGTGLMVIGLTVSTLIGACVAAAALEGQRRGKRAIVSGTLVFGTAGALFLLVYYYLLADVFRENVGIFFVTLAAGQATGPLLFLTVYYGFRVCRDLDKRPEDGA